MPRRGYKLEHEIDKVIKYIDSTNGFATKLYPNKTIDGIFIAGEPFDYFILLPKYKVAFDAKECAGTTWNMKPKDIKQANNLKKVKNAGLHAYFLILFENKDVRQIDIDEVIEVLKQGKKSISMELGKEWELIKILNS